MKKDELLEKVLKSENLPTLPNVAFKLITLTAREDTTLDDITVLVSQDVALSTKILKVANSAFYSFPQQIGSIKQAVSILGINAVRSLVLSFSFLTMKRGKGKSGFNFEIFWEKSLASAVAAKIILEKVKGADTEQIFISGLLQNLGQLIFARTVSEQYDEILQKAEGSDTPLIELEELHFGANHCFIGYEVAKQWGFPEALLQPIIHHHNPDGYEGDDELIKQTVKAVHLSTLLTNIIFSAEPQQFHKEFREKAKKLLGLKQDDIDSILEQFHLQVEQAGEYFDLKVKNTKSIQEILEEANIRLSLMNLDYDQINKQLIQAKLSLEKLTRELEAKNKILDNLANLDELTSTYNHRYFQNTLDQEISRTTRNDGSLSLILADIDHFKKFNDTYGHQTGDFVLKEFANTIRDQLRSYDTLARYGGEEFVIILPETVLDEALMVAEKLRAIIAEKIFTDDVNDYKVTASFGVAASFPGIEDNFSKSNFISQADQALYEAKDKGRNLAIAFSEKKKKWYSF